MGLVWEIRPGQLTPDGSGRVTSVPISDGVTLQATGMGPSRVVGQPTRLVMDDTAGAVLVATNPTPVSQAGTVVCAVRTKISPVRAEIFRLQAASSDLWLALYGNAADFYLGWSVPPVEVPFTFGGDEWRIVVATWQPGGPLRVGIDGTVVGETPEIDPITLNQGTWRLNTAVAGSWPKTDVAYVAYHDTVVDIPTYTAALLDELGLAPGALDPVANLTISPVTLTGEATVEDPWVEPDLPDPAPGGAVLPPPAPEPQLPPSGVPDRVLRRVSEVMPAPTLDGQGNPVDWEPTTVVDTEYGRLQVVVEGTDITYLMGAPVDASWTRTEPFGSGFATIVAPQITPFHQLGSGGLSWCRRGANVDIFLTRAAGGRAQRFAGIIDTFGHSADSGDFTIRCLGVLYQADQQIRLPATDTAPKDAGHVIADTLNSVVGRRYQAVPRVTTGCTTSVLGAWEPRLTGFVQQLLATMVQGGSQWTVACPVRDPHLVRKDTTHITWTVSNGQRGIDIDLDSDVPVNVIYGEGVNSDGGRWRNMRYPNWRPDDTPSFPNWSPIRSIGPGTRDSDTDSGTGVSTWQRKVGQPVTGVFSQQDRVVLRARQKAAGILVDGWLGPQSWATEFATGSNTGSLDGAFPMPLAYSSKVMPRLLGGDGADLGPNPAFDPAVIRVEDKIDFGQGVSLTEGQRAAAEMLARDITPGWLGTVTFTLDPEERSKFDVLEGSNGRIRAFRGRDLDVHVARVDYHTESVVAHVDTKARDYPTLAAIRERERNATDPAKARVRRQTQSRLGSDRATWDAESPGGRVPRHAVYSNLWTVLRIPVAAYGSIVRTQFTTTGPARPFALAVFDRPITAARMLQLVGNPLVTEDNPWQANADALDAAGLLMSWGWNKQPCGYYPGDYSTPDGENQAPVTGRMVDDASWEYSSTRPPWLWVAEIASGTCMIEGRFWHGTS